MPIKIHEIFRKTIALLPPEKQKETKPKLNLLIEKYKEGCDAIASALFQMTLRLKAIEYNYVYEGKANRPSKERQSEMRNQITVDIEFEVAKVVKEIIDVFQIGVPIEEMDKELEESDQLIDSAIKQGFTQFGAGAIVGAIMGLAGVGTLMTGGVAGLILPYVLGWTGLGGTVSWLWGERKNIRNMNLTIPDESVFNILRRTICVLAAVANQGYGKESFISQKDVDGVSTYVDDLFDTLEFDKWLLHTDEKLQQKLNILVKNIAMKGGIYDDYIIL